MSKPFNASSVSKALSGKNNLEVTFVDSDGTKQVVNLSPEARRNLMLALLTRPTLPPADKALKLEMERILNIVEIQAHGLPNGNPVIELILAQNMCIYITFPLEGIKTFLKTLAILEKILISSQIH